MDTSSYELFQRALHIGKRAEAASALSKFVASFSSLQEKETWAKNYLVNEYSGRKIRHEIYQHILFPVLIDGYRKSDPWSIKWLARTTQNLYQSQNLWQQIDRKTDIELLEELLSLCPDDEETRIELLKRKIEWFKYSGHEWPAGILYGKDGATIDECDEILEDVAQAECLDTGNVYEEFLNEFKRKVNEYIKRLSTRLTDGSSGQ